MHERHGKDFLFGAMLGSTLGALTALMFTTKKGHKIQHQLMDKYHEFEEVVRHYADGKTRQAKRMARRALSEIKKQAKRKVRKARRRRR